MSLQRTLSIIKPDAVKRHLIGAILARFEQQGFKVIAAKMVHFTQEQAEGFYAQPQGKPFFWTISGIHDFCTGIRECVRKRKCRARLPHFNRYDES